jgi:putative transposase
MLIDAAHPELPVSRQCELLGLSRSTWYYQRRPADPGDEQFMRLIDERYLQRPFFGVRSMTTHLNRRGYPVNVKRVRRLMRLMGLEAVYPKPRRSGLSLPDKDHRVYPYLLKGLEIVRPDQVWATDITYIPMRRGWLYLAAVMDWFSRYVLAWELSATLDSAFCVRALERALSMGTPEIFNTDQGSQFTSEAFTSVLLNCGIRISMDGAGRAFDNIFVERLWRSVKYEEVYLHDYDSPVTARRGLAAYFEFYNNDRPHQGLDNRTPAEAYGLATAMSSPTSRGGSPGDAFAMVGTPVALRAPSVPTIARDTQRCSPP